MIMSITILLFAPLLSQALSRLGHVRKKQFVGCSAGEEKQIRKAAIASNKLVGNALDYLNTISSGSGDEQFMEWFGTDSLRSHNIVDSHFESIRKSATSLIYDCTTCSIRYPKDHRSLSAYNGPRRAGKQKKMNICEKFWEAPITSADPNINSKAGIILRSNLHFKINVTDTLAVYDAPTYMRFAEAIPQKKHFRKGNRKPHRRVHFRKGNRRPHRKFHLRRPHKT
ncbi:hypothetical protein V565_081620 [Rhizoctonia solani 123E]|uniref:Lysine-specific metallo-endopeptidase domain-containing protein n=1 Tax=Rhizoctonia solani 123E TaxID=1423351 RepID=A0A074RYI5_9AGAM|nr:hypothetical protein V565_081620 [Rhizoctonia solani 123E]